ncbi:MAG: copper resistance protein NlpE [Lactobacillus sp.]|jgi:hypothetical protein|nr:copper resistance protein NlpE [Lactobacillus sp.]
MRKRTLFGLLGVVVILGAAYYSYYRQANDINVKYDVLNTYFVKSDIPLEEDNINYFLIENQEEMDAVLGIAKTMTNEVEKIDFSKELIIAIAYPATNFDSKIVINSLQNISGRLYLDYSFTQGDEREFSIIPARIISFTKPKNLLDIYFSMDDNTDRKIAMGRRTLGSPISLDDMKQNYTGSYKATLPCADCPGIETRLVLNPDMTYELFETYIDKNKIPFKEEGKWSISDDLALVKLDKSNTYYFIDDSSVIEKADTEGKRIDSELNYRLIKE